MLSLRVLTAVVGIPVLLYLVYLEGIFLTIGTGVLAVAGLAEFWNLLRRLGLKPVAWVGYSGGLLFVIGAYSVSANTMLPVAPTGLTLTAIILAGLAVLVFAHPRYTVTDIAGTLLGTVYIGWLFSHIILLRGLENGFRWVLLALILSWAYDTCAYFVGCGLGRHKMAPVLSPNKTWEGAAGGLAGSVLAGIVFRFVVGDPAWVHVLGLGFLAAVAAQTGDLAESALKRTAGVKDSGILVPGHGGVLDRFDSPLLTIPVVYYYLNFFISGVR